MVYSLVIPITTTKFKFQSCLRFFFQCNPIFNEVIAEQMTCSSPARVIDMFHILHLKVVHCKFDALCLLMKIHHCLQTRNISTFHVVILSPGASGLCKPRLEEKRTLCHKERTWSRRRLRKGN